MKWASENGITWRFVVPRAPHLEAVWEAAVKSAKYHLNRVIKKQALSYEDSSTVFTQIEGILNSRPISYHRESDKSVIMITPAHLSIGRPLSLSINEPTDVSHSLRARYYLIRNSQFFLDNMENRLPIPAPSQGQMEVFEKECCCRRYCLAEGRQLAPKQLAYGDC